MTKPLTALEREILLVAYHFAPADHTGTRRMTAFAQYLPEQGYRPVVLTTKKFGSQVSDSAQRVFRAAELGSLMITLPSRLAKRIRQRPEARQQPPAMPALDADSLASRMLIASLIPDVQVTWYPLAVRRGLRLLRERPIKLILSSAPPNTSHLVALRLKRLTGLPWVADFRDGWMFEPPNPAPFGNPLRTRVEFALEALILRHADQIVTVNQPIADDFAQRYPQAAGKIVVVSNGYDPATLKGLKRTRPNDGRLRLVYTGSLTLSRAGTSLDALLGALRGLHTNEPQTASELELVLVGELTTAEKAIIAAAGLGHQIHLVGKVSHREALQHQTDADVLLLVTVAGQSGVTTNKLFEYLASGHPILALTGRSPAADLIRELDAGPIVAPDDVMGIQNALGDLHRRWRAGDLGFKNNRSVERFSRPQLTAKLARCFDRLLGDTVSYHELGVRSS